MESRAHASIASKSQDLDLKISALPDERLPHEGQIVEILSQKDDHASRAWALGWLAKAQHQAHICAWIQVWRGFLSDVDVTRFGVNKLAMHAIELPQPMHRDPYAVLRSTEILVRSGGFGLVVVDLTGMPNLSKTAWQAALGRFGVWVRRHRCRLVWLRSVGMDTAPLGGDVDVRMWPRWQMDEEGGRLVLDCCPI